MPNQLSLYILLILDTLWFYFSVCVHCLIFCFVHQRCVSRHQPQTPKNPELLRKMNSDQSFSIPRDVCKKTYFDYVFGVPGINMRIYFKLKILSLFFLGLDRIQICYFQLCVSYFVIVFLLFWIQLSIIYQMNQKTCSF